MGGRWQSVRHVLIDEPPDVKDGDRLLLHDQLHGAGIRVDQPVFGILVFRCSDVGRGRYENLQTMLPCNLSNLVNRPVARLNLLLS